MQLFREVRKQYTRAVRKEKASFFKQKCASCSTNSKKLWDTVKSMENKSTSSQLPTALRLGNTVTKYKSTIIENFNVFFYSWLSFPPGYPYRGQQPCTSHSNLPKPPHFSFTQK
jgi:hypothetical protein